MRRRARNLVAFLLRLIAGGAIVNVAVATSCAYWMPRSREEVSRRFANPPYADTSLSRGIAVVDEQINNRALMSSAWGLKEEMIIGSIVRYIDGSLHHLSDGAWRRGWGSEFHDSGRWIWLTTAGWPFWSLQGCHVSTGKATKNLPPRWGFWTGQSETAPVIHMTRGDRFIPYRPLMPGFAINTIFYAAILWVMFALPAKARRYFRGKRGLCPACAYPIGVSEVCTECGQPVARRMTA